MRGWRRNNPEKTREIKRRSYYKNKDKHSGESAIHMRTWRKKNIERDRKNRREWHHKNKAKCALWSKMRYLRNPEKHKLAYRKWVDENRAYVYAKNAERRAGLGRAMPRWVDRKAIEKFYDEAKRLTLKTGIIHHVDHIYPLTHPWLQGLHVPWNLRVIQASKNTSKNNKVTPEMLAQSFR